MAYLDLTTEFDYKDLVTAANLDALAENDAVMLQRSGGTMTGTLTLAADPANPLEASTKQYVDLMTLLNSR